MATKAKKVNETIIESTTKKVLGLTTKANDFALNTTEKVFTKSFGLAEKVFDFSNKAIKYGLRVSASQQNMVFDTLESVKGKMVKAPKKSK